MKEAKKYTNEQLEETLNLAQRIKAVQDDKSFTKKQQKKQIRQLVKENKKSFFMSLGI